MSDYPAPETTHRQCPHHLQYSQQNRNYEILLLLLFHTFSVIFQHLNIITNLISSTKWTDFLHCLHTSCVCVCVRGERGLLLLLCKIFQLLCCYTHYNSRFKLLAHILSLTHTTATTARTLRDDVSRRCIFVVGHSKSKRQLKNKRENRTTSHNNNKRNVLSINY